MSEVNENEVQKFVNEEMGFEVEAIIGVNTEPVFVAKDVCQNWGIVNHRQAVADADLDTDEQASVKLTAGGQAREMLCVTESGLYALIMNSRKPEAKEFKRWIRKEVLPSIRKTGSYGLAQNEATINSMIDSKLKGVLRLADSGFKSLQEEQRKTSEDIEELKKALPFSDEFKLGVTAPIAYTRGMIADVSTNINFIAEVLADFPKKLDALFDVINPLLKNNTTESEIEVKTNERITSTEYVLSKISELLAGQQFKKRELTRKTQKLSQDERDHILDLLVDSNILEKTVIGHETNYRMVQNA